MAQWSNFAPFGEFSFGGEDSESERIYNAQTTALGPAFAGSVGEAETYADAMCFGASRLQLQAAGAQDDPEQVNYLIDALEKDWRLRPGPNDTLTDRRAALAFAMASATGSFTAAVTAGLTVLLGTLLVNFRCMNEPVLDEVTPSATFPPHSPLAGTAIKHIVISDLIIPGQQTVAYTRTLDDGNGIISGEKLVVNPGVNGMEDIVTVTAATSTTLTATFTLPQDAGTVAITGPFCRWSSNQRHSLVIVDRSVLANNALLVKTHEYMRKVMPAVSTWIVCAETIPGVVGPFSVGQGLIGQTPIGEDPATVWTDARKASFLPVSGAYLVMPLTQSGTNYGVAGGSLTISGAPTFSADGITFDGVDDFAFIDQTNVPTEYTLVFRAKFPVVSAGPIPCVFYSTSSTVEPAGGVSISRDATWTFITNDWVDFGLSVALSDNQWHTFSVVQSATNRKFYVDGGLAYTTATSSTSVGSIMKLGGMSTGGTKEQIIVKNLVSYSSELSAANRTLVEYWSSNNGILTEVP